MTLIDDLIYLNRAKIQMDLNTLASLPWKMRERLIKEAENYFKEYNKAIKM